MTVWLKTLYAHPTLRVFLTVAFDLAAAGLSVVAAFYLRTGDDIGHYTSILAYAVPLFMAITAVTFYLFGMYKGLWRYASMADLATILKAATLALLVYATAMFQAMRLEEFPRSVLVIQWLLLVMALGGARLAIRMLGDMRVTMQQDPTLFTKAVPILLAGTDESAEMFIRSVIGSFSGRYRIVGIVDGAGGHQVGRSIHGITIMGEPPNIEAIVKRLERNGQAPEGIIFSPSFLANDSDQFAEFASKAEARGLRLSRLPVLEDFRRQLEGGNINLSPISIEDLLGREQTRLDIESIRTLIAGRRVLVTGAGGSIGSELTRRIADFGPAHLVLLDHSEFQLYEIEQEIRFQSPTLSYTSVIANIRSKERLRQVFEAHKPEIVFHAAALKHVPMVELNPAEGVQTNAIGTFNVAETALECGVLAMVQISTDKAVNPTNVMGATKRMAEHYCQALDIEGGKTGGRCRFMTVRFGNVMGSSGSVVPLFKKQLERGGPLTVTHPEMERFFMSIPEAVGLVLQAAAHGLKTETDRGQIFVLDMGKPVKIVDVARRMIRLAGLEPDRDIRIVFTGLRPGEKLYEELFNSGETALETTLPGILAAVPRPIELTVLRRFIERLAAAAEKNDEAEIRQILQTSVPGYVPSMPAVLEAKAEELEEAL